MITERKLVQTCATCNGCGHVDHPDWVIWRCENTEDPPEGHPLRQVKETMLCPDCYGFGTVVACHR